MTARRESKVVTKSVRFSPEETALIESISRREHVSEATLMRKLVLEGIARLRLDQAVADYAAGDLNLGEAAHAAGVGVRRMMMELDRRGIDLSRESELPNSLETLADLFGGSPELRETITQLRAGDL
jgi:predicted HTH domain antitoxin